MMHWKKMGLIFTSNGEFEWNKTHATLPTIDILKNGITRIYYSSRDSKNISYISFIEVETDNPSNVLYVHKNPVISPGKSGMFDDCGVMPSMIMTIGDEKWMYYLGWNVRNTIPYHNAIGLAISKDGGRTFKKFSDGPLFDRNYFEPYYSAVPFVIIENGLWRMWYLSNTDWVCYKGRMEPFYHIKYAESLNGIDWKREGKVAINFKNENECGIVRACVLNENNKYKMWYSYRNLQNYRTDKNNSYRIGYAESNDGIEWFRMDDLSGITVSESGWDSEMIEYPYVYLHDEKYYMIYNGNGFGKTGFGYAVLT